MCAKSGDGLTRDLTLVCAPAGFGKTSLLADKVGNQPTAWLSLDTGDNDPARFLRYTVAALDHVQPGIAQQIMPMLGPPAPTSFDWVATAIVNHLAAHPGDVTLILDLRQPEHIRTFLLETSALSRVSGPLCDAVTDRPNSQKLLETIEAENLFLVPLDEPTWVARIIDQHFDELYLSSEGATFLRLPTEIADSRPRPHMTKAASYLLAGRVREVEDSLDAAERTHLEHAEESFEPSVGRAASRLVNSGCGCGRPILHSAPAR